MGGVIPLSPGKIKSNNLKNVNIFWEDFAGLVEFIRSFPVMQRAPVVRFDRAGKSVHFFYFDWH